MTDRILPEMFYAAALAAYYCSTDDGWDNFITWAKGEGILQPGEEMSRELMHASCAGVRLICRQVEIELLDARLSQVLSDES